MNATDFIKQNGVDKAREVVEGAPEGSTHFVGSTYLKLIGAVWWNAWLPEWSHKDNCMVKKWKCESIELMKTWGEVYKLDELKRLVESIYLVKEHNTLDRAIEYANSTYTAPEIKVCLLDAIADYKSAYSNDMGDDTHIENHVSPLCKVGG